MANPSKNVEDLQVTINVQEEQLNKYKKRLQDVVIAHKKLLAEKSRLEETLRTITAVKSADEVQNDANDISDSEKKINELKSKVTKLALSLSSLSDEKCQLEAQFQLERKHLNEKNLQLEEELKQLTTNSKNDRSENAVQINQESRERELELLSNIRELQKIINEERKKRENKEFFIEKLKEQLKLTQEKLNEAKNSEKILRSRLTETENLSDDDNPSQKVMEKLKSELQVMQERHDLAVRQEQIRALKAEEKMRKLSIEHENRVSKLEQKLTQLSDLASRYDKHRQDDQHIISKLKNRLMQLELENSNVKCEDDRIPLSEEALIQQLQHIKHELLQNCKTPQQLNKLKEILCDGLELVPNSDAKKYKELYIHLKQQFDERQRNNSRESIDENMSVSKQKIQKLKNRVLELESSNSYFQKQLESERENIEKLLEDERRSWKTKMSTLESEYHNKLIIMERELEKQRERTTHMLEEKEKQLYHLQQRYFPVYQFSDEGTEKKMSYRGMQKRQNSTLIYYLEDAARKEGDINRLRKINNECQEKIHELEKDHFYQNQLYTQLQEEIQRLHKEQDGNEDLNRRYLKNVFLNYLNTVDPKMKSHMLNAIFAILKFSDIEMNRVLKLQKGQS